MTWFDVERGTELPLAADFRTFVERLTAAESFDPVDPDGSRPAL
ncbi:hypothetical protein [Streptomyces pratensis]|nr:hypothetical protein [Streptomyces pratensis]